MKIIAFFNAHIKAFKVIAAVIAFAMTAGLLWFANELLGNPVSYLIVKNNAKKYVAENYADEGYVLKGVSYNFEWGQYSATVEKPGSEDCIFGLSYTMIGKLSYNDYQTRIEDGVNTRNRLYRNYYELIATTTDTSTFPYICSGQLIFEYDDYLVEPLGFGLSKNILVPDAQYDINKLGAQAGVLYVIAVEDVLTPEKAAEILLKVDSFMEQNGVQYHSINVHIYSADYSSYEDREERYILEFFNRSDIHSDDLVELIKQNNQKTEEFYANLNKQDSLKPDTTV